MRKKFNLAEEEYLKAVLALSGKNKAVRTKDVANALGLAPASATQMLEKMAKKRLLRHSPYKGEELTQKGREDAEAVLRRYQLLERFFIEYLRISPSEAAHQACLMEHFISKETQRRICQIMKHPEKSMGNKPMPKCRLEKDCDSCMEKFPAPKAGRLLL